MKRFYAFLLIVFGMSLTVANAQDTTGLYTVNGTQLYIKIIGEGDPILIVHGGPGLNHEYFLPHLLPLAKNHKLIFYDQRSSGKSQLSVRANMNFNTFAADIEAIRVLFNIEKLDIICHSWGALPVTTYLQQYPDHVRSIVYANPTPLNNELAGESTIIVQNKISPADSAKRADLMLSEGFKKGDMAVINQLMMLSFKQLFCDTNKLALLDPKLPNDYLVASLSLYGFAADMKKYDLYAQIKDNPTPVLIIRGVCDISPETADNRLKQCFTNAQLFVFEHSGHFSFIEENKLFVKRVNKFYKGLK
ncbi:MAG: alpha/beta hydrolase [Chitinophagales bacterium]|nr:alpha/beta hydrolase [Bacteroidota bacterium]